MSVTLGDARTTLGIRLHDSSHAQWTAAEKSAFVLSGIRRTLARTGTYMSTQSLTVTASTHTYDASPVYDIKAVRLGDVVLEPKSIVDMPVIEENWDALPVGQPTRWVPYQGTHFRVAPAPSAYYAGMIDTIAAAPTAGGTGYVAGDILSVTTTGDDAKVVVDSVTGGVVTAVSLHSTTDSQGRTIYYRGGTYTVGTGKATTADTGSGTGCTISITALCKLEAYGPAEVADIPFTTACTMVLSTDLVSCAGHGLSANDAIEFGSTTGGVSVNTTYYVISTGLTTSVFAFSATYGGSAFNITADGANTFGPSIIDTISESRQEAYLKAAEEEAWLSRPSIPAAGDRAARARGAWLEECALIASDFGLGGA